MTISLSDAGKRFNRDWIFRHFNYTFTTGNSYAIVGPNGSGKSTLLQAIGGAIGLSEGKLVVIHESLVVRRESSIVSNKSGAGSQKSIVNSQEPGDNENIYRHISIAAPYLEVIEEMTVTEFLQFHQTFKSLLPALSISEIIEVVGLSNAAGKQIRYYSSGMKQRVKLAQAILRSMDFVKTE
jgi:ABC-2 type transport system ATP-binding protein